MRPFLLLLVCFSFTWAGHPNAFSVLGGALESELATLRALEGMSWITRGEVDAYARAQQACFEMGDALDAALRSERDGSGELRLDYLSCLRNLQKQSDRWERRYAGALQKAIDTDTQKDFERLVTHPLEPLQRQSLRERALAYYDGIRGTHKIGAMEALREVDANTQYAEDDETFEQGQTVTLGTSGAGPAKGPVVVSAKERYSGFVFYAKNRNSFPVTLTLSLSDIKNFKASEALPFSVELTPHSEKKLLNVDIVDRAQGASMLPRYSWVMGRASAKHSDPLYRLPFAVGSGVTVSQGFDGGVTHTGRSRYAVDFSCAVGTEVYAARGGKVIAARSGRRRGGFDKRFRAETNYIVIEHDDHTLGKYAHLKYNGVKVTVGETVQTGRLIGYSGNTGYSSGPHLHFSVSSVDPDSKDIPVTLPFRFLTAGGVVETPKTKDRYQVVNVR